MGEPGDELRRAVEEKFAELPAELQRAGFSPVAVAAAETMPELRYETAGYSLAQLEETTQELLPYGDTTEVWGIGPDSANSHVVVYVTDDEAGRRTVDEIVRSQPEGLIRVNAGPMPKPIDGRFDDSPPWNAGNQVAGYGNHRVCTTNFGFHNFPYVGGQGIDAQAIDPGVNGSSCVSWGGVSNPPFPMVRYAVTGYYDPLPGTQVITSGSVQFETSTSITNILPYIDIQVGATPADSYRIINISVLGIPHQHGDSGGPVIMPSIYGPLAAGMVTATTPTDTFIQQINSLRYAFQADPNVSPNGYTC